MALERTPRINPVDGKIFEDVIPTSLVNAMSATQLQADGLQTNLTNLTTTVNTLSTNVSNIDGTVSTLSTNVTSLTSSLANLTTRVTNVESSASTNAGAIATNASDISALQAALANHSEVRTNFLRNTEMIPAWSDSFYGVFNIFRSGGGAVGGADPAPKPAPLGGRVVHLGPDATNKVDWAVWGGDTIMYAGENIAWGVWVFCAEAVTVRSAIRHYNGSTGGYTSNSLTQDRDVPAGVWTWIQGSGQIPTDKDGTSVGFHIHVKPGTSPVPKIWVHRPVVGRGTYAPYWVPHEREAVAKQRGQAPEYNDYFDLWYRHSNYPAGWAVWGGAAANPVRVEEPENNLSARLNVGTDAQDAGLASSQVVAHIPIDTTHVTCKVEFTLHSGTLEGAGPRMQANAPSGNTQYLGFPLAATVPNPVLGRRYCVTITGKYAPHATTTSVGCYVFANYLHPALGFTAKRAKEITYHSVSFRVATEAEKSTVP